MTRFKLLQELAAQMAERRTSEPPPYRVFHGNTDGNGHVYRRYQVTVPNQGHPYTMGRVYTVSAFNEEQAEELVRFSLSCGVDLPWNWPGGATGRDTTRFIPEYIDQEFSDITVERV